MPRNMQKRGQVTLLLALAGFLSSGLLKECWAAVVEGDHRGEAVTLCDLMAAGSVGPHLRTVSARRGP